MKSINKSIDELSPNIKVKLKLKIFWLNAKLVLVMTISINHRLSVK